jgi:hypothetical protein
MRIFAFDAGARSRPQCRFPAATGLTSPKETSFYFGIIPDWSYWREPSIAQNYLNRVSYIEQPFAWVCAILKQASLRAGHLHVHTSSRRGMPSAPSSFCKLTTKVDWRRLNGKIAKQPNHQLKRIRCSQRIATYSFSLDRKKELLGHRVINEIWPVRPLDRSGWLRWNTRN